MTLGLLFRASVIAGINCGGLFSGGAISGLSGVWVWVLAGVVVVGWAVGVGVWRFRCWGWCLLVAGGRGGAAFVP